MFNKKLVYQALERTKTGLEKGGDSLVSLLIHDVFGGEILKTHLRKNWHFYNRIDGEIVDFTKKKTPRKNVEDIPSTPDETCAYLDQVDYSTFFERFVRAFEEIVGLDNYRAGLRA